VLIALLRRHETGRGDHIDIAMHDALLAACPNVLGPVMADGRHPVVKHQRSTGGSAFYQIYDTRDGRQLVLAGQEEKFVRTLLEAFGRPDLAPLCARGPGAHQQPVIDFLRETFRQRDLADWMDDLATLDVCWAPVNTLPEALDDPNLRARDALLTDAAGRRHIAPPIRFLDEPAKPVLREPLVGEHTAQVLAVAEQ
jgi:crotonobetainyl-CoA:carnitine CoA-transferase CaiB-like acyl-CoA transferase